VGHNEQICGELLVPFHTIFKNFLINVFLSSNGCASYASRIWLQVTKTTLTFC